ncbi:MAG: hypothetical protein ACEQSA_04255 [Weeksellaceae bacterium]
MFDLLAEAREILRPHLPTLQSGRKGPYSVSFFNNGLLIEQSVANQTIHHVSFTFSKFSKGNREVDNLIGMTVITSVNPYSSFSLQPDKITGQHGSWADFPSWEYEWTLEGNLTQARVNLDGQTFALYNLRYPAVKQGNPIMLAALPEELIQGVTTEIFGAPVPWTLDFEPIARIMLEKSKLKEIFAS